MSNKLEIYKSLAIEASQQAYIPYSDYAVGAVLVASDGEQLFTGCNVENASYPASICAERTALVKAVSEGVRDFSKVIVATKNGGSPCGICRQMLYEFSPSLQVVCITFDGDVTIDKPLHDLLADGFGPTSLNT
ncbi:MAG: cytidine deaminase [Chloroflexota bacterium]